MPSGYIIANVRVTNPEQYEEYKKWSTAKAAWSPCWRWPRKA